MGGRRGGWMTQATGAQEPGGKGCVCVFCWVRGNKAAGREGKISFPATESREFSFPHKAGSSHPFSPRTLSVGAWSPGVRGPLIHKGQKMGTVDIIQVKQWP